MSYGTAPAHDDYSADYPYQPQPAVMGVDNRVEEPAHQDRWVLFFQRQAGFIAAVCLFLFFVGINFAICPIMAATGGPPDDWSYLPIFALFGVILSETALLSAWLVFSSSPFWFRSASFGIAAIILWASWAAGLFLAAWVESWQVQEDFQLASLALPLAALAIQSPLWFLRCYSGWRFVNRDAEPVMNRQLSIRDYFVGTSIAAICVALARLSRPADASPNEFWLAMLILFTFFACGGLLSVPPAMLLLFRFRSFWLGLVLFILYSLIISLITMGILSASIKRWPPALESAVLITIFASLAVFVGLGMKIARECGYALIMGRKSRMHAQ